MGVYVARRILFAVVTLFFITIIVFFIAVRIPESVLEDVCSRMMVSQESEWDCMDGLRKEYGLDQPVYLHYWNWITAVSCGDFGQSIWTSRPLADEISRRFPVTFELIVISFIFAHLITVPLAFMHSWLRKKSVLIISKIFEGVFSAVPIFWLLIIIYVFLPVNSQWRWTSAPAYTTFGEDWSNHLKLFTIPAIILGFYISATLLKTYLEIIHDTFNSYYIRTARAKGLQKSVIFIHHGLRSILVPMLKKLATVLPVIFGLAIFVEMESVLPGISRFFIDAIATRDFRAASAVLFILAIFCLVVFLLTNLLCAWLDPRLRHPDLQQASEYL